MSWMRRRFTSAQMPSPCNELTFLERCYEMWISAASKCQNLDCRGIVAHWKSVCSEIIDPLKSWFTATPALSDASSKGRGLASSRCRPMLMHSLGSWRLPRLSLEC